MKERKRAGIIVELPCLSASRGPTAVIFIFSTSSWKTASRNVQKGLSKLEHFLNLYYATSIRSVKKATSPL